VDSVCMNMKGSLSDRTVGVPAHARLSSPPLALISLAFGTSAYCHKWPILTSVSTPDELWV
jgi:hypothetical protein